jgi:hypothetical protein
MVGRTLYLEGTVTKGEFSGGFTVSWGGSARIPVAFQDGSGHGHGAGARRGGVRAQADDFLLNLGPGAPTTLAVGKSCAGWFDGIDFTTASSGQVTAAVVAHLRNSFHHHVPEPAVGN